MMYKRWRGYLRPVSNGATVLRAELAADEDAPGRARALLSRLRGQVDEDVLERGLLLTSELVTNSVRYAGGGDIRVEVWQAGRSLAVVVTDHGTGIPAVPEATAAQGSAGGLGLTLVDAFSGAWGSGCDSDAWVWFEVSPSDGEQPMPDVAPAARTEGEQLLDIRMVVDSVKHHAIVALDADGNITNWGASAAALTGYDASEMLGRPLSDVYVPAATQAFALDRAAVESHGSQKAERRLRRKNGSPIWVEVALSPILDRSGKRRGLSAVISDVTERKRAQDTTEYLIAELREQAMTDELTGLPNRRRWAQELNRELARSRRLGTPLAIVMLDLDGFKAFNDQHGHPAGDELLRAVAREWAEAVRVTDMLARFGGDEFSVTLPDCPPQLSLLVVARVQAATPSGIASSAGIASSDGSQSADELIARADAALYEAKRRALGVSVA